MKNNKGLTLVELLVTIAIVGVISSAILGFIITGSNSYKSTSADVNVQYEAQLTMNQLQDLIIDANDVQILQSPIVGAKIYYDSYLYEIQWEQTGQKLIYYKCAITNGEIAPKTTENSYMLSNCVSDFKIGIDTVDKKVVQTVLEFNQHGKKYSTFQNITLRNKNNVRNSANDGSEKSISFLIEGPTYVNRFEDFTLHTNTVGITDWSNYTVEWQYKLLKQNGLLWSEIPSEGILNMVNQWDSLNTTWKSNYTWFSQIDILSNYKVEVTAVLKDTNNKSIATAYQTINIGRVKIKFSLVKDGLYTDNLDINLTNDPISIYYKIEGVTEYSIDWTATNGYGDGDGNSNNIKVDINNDYTGVIISVQDKNSGGKGKIIPHLYIDSTEYALDEDNLITYTLLPPGQEMKLEE